MIRVSLVAGEKREYTPLEFGLFSIGWQAAESETSRSQEKNTQHENRCGQNYDSTAVLLSGRV
jgi:hypothetical protein